jgi:DNA polymerase alpha subunit A
MRSRGLTAAAGDTIPYLICRSSAASTSVADCAFHPDELKRSSELQIDTDWYLQTQIHPPVARLCEHLDGTDSAQLAQCLGLDTKKYQNSLQSAGRDASLLSQVKFLTRMPDEERFAQVERLKVACASCSTLQEFEGIIKGSNWL